MHTAKIRVVSFNVFYALGKKRLEKTFFEALERIRPDAICLQEALAGKKRDFARDVAKKLGYHALFSRRATLAGRRIGIAVLLHEANRDGTSIVLPGSSLYRPRILQIVTTRTHHIQWRVANTHLYVGSFVNRRKQLAAVIQALDDADHTLPTVLAGDFNTKTKREVEIFTHMLQDAGFQVPKTIPYSWKLLGIKRQLDWIAARHCAITAAGVLQDVKGSDHKPVWADIMYQAKS